MAAFHNSRSDSSEKSAENSVVSVDSRAPRRNPAALKLAAQLASQLGMPRTWPNVETIRLAIQSEAEYSDVSISNAAALITVAALEFTPVIPERYNFQTATILRKSNNVNRFWFEDSLWRCKDAYDKMLYHLQQQKQASA